MDISIIINFPGSVDVTVLGSYSNEQDANNALIGYVNENYNYNIKSINELDYFSEKEKIYFSYINQTIEEDTKWSN